MYCDHAELKLSHMYFLYTIDNPMWNILCVCVEVQYIFGARIFSAGFTFTKRSQVRSRSKRYTKFFPWRVQSWDIPCCWYIFFSSQHKRQFSPELLCQVLFCVASEWTNSVSASLLHKISYKIIFVKLLSSFCPQTIPLDCVKKYLVHHGRYLETQNNCQLISIII